MSRDAHTPRTTKTRLPLPLNGTIFVTTRDVASEKPLPVVGATMAAEVGASSPYAQSRIIAVQDSPATAIGKLVITHAIIPSEADQLASNWEHSTCDIGGVKFDSVQRTIIMLAADYSESSPAIGSALVANPAGAPNLGSGYVLADRQAVRSGTELEPVFRVERRNYVKKVTLGEIEVDSETGVASRSETTLYYSGETVITGKTINQLMAEPTHEFWGTRDNGFARQGAQLSERWFSVTDRKTVNLDTQWEKSADRLRPEKFFCPKQTRRNTTITANNTPGPPSDPSASLGTSITIGKVGRIEKITTIEQTGSPQILKSLELLPDDGYIYPASEELVSSDAVPAIKSFINGNGQVVTFNNVDACNAVKITRQGMSTEDEQVKVASQLIPAEFLDSEKTDVLIETTLGSSGPPSNPNASNKEQVKVRKKGVVETRETTIQVGETKALVGSAYLPDDGISYPTEKSILLTSQMPSIPPSIQTDGTIETFEPNGASHVIKTKRVVESPLPGKTKKVSKLAPEKFFKEQRSTQIDTVMFGVSSDAPDPVAADKKSTQIEQRGKIRRQRVIEQLGDLAPIKGTTFDERTGESFNETQEVVANTDVNPEGVTAGGDLVSYDGLDANWSVKTQRKLVSTLRKSWSEVINYEWPAVLTSLDFVTWTSKRRGATILPIPRYKEAYSGPQLVQVEQWWQKEQPTHATPISMVAEGIQFWSPLLKISIPPCLHPTFTLFCNIGSDDPDWEAQNFSQTFPATNLPDWPNQIIWTESKPYVGGFLMHRYTLNRPQ